MHARDAHEMQNPGTEGDDVQRRRLDCSIADQKRYWTILELLALDGEIKSGGRRTKQVADVPCAEPEEEAIEGEGERNCRFVISSGISVSGGAI